MTEILFVMIRTRADVPCACLASHSPPFPGVALSSYVRGTVVFLGFTFPSDAGGYVGLPSVKFIVIVHFLAEPSACQKRAKRRPPPTGPGQGTHAKVLTKPPERSEAAKSRGPV